MRRKEEEGESRGEDGGWVRAFKKPELSFSAAVDGEQERWWWGGRKRDRREEEEGEEKTSKKGGGVCAE